MSTPVRTGVTVAFAAAMALGVAPSSPAAASPGPTPRHTGLRSASAVTAGGVGASRGWLSDAIASGAVRDRSERQTLGTQVISRASTTETSTAAVINTGASASAPPACDSGEGRVHQLTDRTVIDLSVVGAATITVLRQRQFGTWLNVGTAAGPTGQLTDLSVNPRSSYSYRVVAKSGPSSTLADCVIASPRGLMGIWTNDGWGEPDAVLAAGNGGLRESASLDDGAELATGSWVAPSYSADGRLVAATLVDKTSGAGSLKVLSARTGAKAFSIDLGVDVFASEAAFSQDGQSMVFARYEATSGAPLGLGVVDVHGSHVVHLLSPDRPLAEPTWKPDNRTIVATDLTDGGGLVTLCSTCSVTTPVPGTTGGYTPEVGPDGRIWFGWADAAGSELRSLTGSTVTTLRREADAGWIWSMPRLLPDGRLFVKVDAPAGGDPMTFVSRVLYVGASPDWDREMWLGQPIGGFLGYDVRQPQSKGTSDFVGTPYDDVLAKDAGGTLWAYNGTTVGLNGRSRLGSGWNGYLSFLAVGDLTSDDRADLLAKDSSGRLWLYAGLGNGRFTARRQVGSGFASYTLVASGDLNGDDLADLVAKDRAGLLWLYPGRGTGALGARLQIGSGWNGMTAIIGSGDVTFDSRADLMARSSDGKLWIFPGTGPSTGRLGRAVQVGSGWGGFTALTVTEIKTLRATLWARSPTGVLKSYQLYGDGKINPEPPVSVGSGWGGLVLSS